MSFILKFKWDMSPLTCRIAAIWAAPESRIANNFKEIVTQITCKPYLHLQPIISQTNLTVSTVFYQFGETAKWAIHHQKHINISHLK